MISDKAKAAILDECCQKVDCLARGKVIDLEGAPDLHQSTSPVIETMSLLTEALNHLRTAPLANAAAIGSIERARKSLSFDFAPTPNMREALEAARSHLMKYTGGFAANAEENALFSKIDAALADTSTVCTTSNSDGSLASGMQMPATEGAITQRPAHPMDTISGGPVGPSDSSPEGNPK
jgi:hypothetical protein